MTPLILLLLTLHTTVSGVYSDIISGQCSANSCAEGALCAQVKQNEYICQCDGLHYGARCEYKRGETDFNQETGDFCGKNQPCLNGGICTNTDSGFVCSCPEGFNGEKCEIEPFCKPESCVNGYCIDEINGSKCICDSGWMGDRCQLDIDECFHSPCSLGSTCLNKNGTFECICKEGQTGPRCEFEKSQCQNDRECLNGGHCIDNSCICSSDFEGPNCELKYHDPCISNQCWDNKICVANRSEILGFSCVCPSGFGGRFCNTKIDLPEQITAPKFSTVELSEAKMTDITLILLVKPSVFVKKVDDFLSALSQRLKTSVKIRKSEGKMEVYEWNSDSGEGKIVDFGSRTDARFEIPTRGKRSTLNSEILHGVLVVIELNLSDCSRKCFSDANQVAHFIKETEAEMPVDARIPIHDAILMNDHNKNGSSTNHVPLLLLLIGLLALVLIGVIVLGVKRRLVISAPVWQPPTKESVRESNNYYSFGYGGGYSGYQNFTGDASKLPTPVFKPQPAEHIRPESSKLELAAIGDERITPEMRPLSSLPGRYSRTPLHWLALNEMKSSADIQSDCAILISFGIDVNAQDEEGNTALHYACRNARFPLVTQLLEAGADPTIDNELDMTSLHEAAKHFDDRAIEAIIAHKVYKDTSKFDHVDLQDRTPLMLYAANSCHSVRGIELMLKAGADINFAGDKKRAYRYKGKTALHHAAESNTDNKKLIEYLVSKNANKDAQDVEEATPLWLAVNANNYLATDELLKAGASLDFADQKERTPEVLAMEKGYSRISERLRIARLKCPTIGMLPSSFPAFFNQRSTVIPPPRIIKKPILKKLTPATPQSELSTTPSPPGLKAGPSCLDSPHSDRLSAPSANSSSEMGSPGYQPVYTLAHAGTAYHPMLPAAHHHQVAASGMRPSPPYDQHEIAAHAAAATGAFPPMQLPPLSLQQLQPLQQPHMDSYPQFEPYNHYQPPACAFQK